MARYRSELPRVILSNEERSYLAGLFDGEGSVCILRAKPPTLRRPTPKYELRVGVVMTHAPTVQRFYEVFGGAPLRLDKRRAKTKYMWTVSQLLALRCLTTLTPALRVRRQHAEIAARFMATFRGNKRGRNPLAPAVFNERLRLVEDMSALNDSHWRQKRRVSG